MQEIVKRKSGNRKTPALAVLAAIPLGLSAGDLDRIDQGKAIAMEKSKGNCLACHVIAGGVLPGNIGPPLFAMKARFPDASVLQKQIWDATIANPDSRMPPFGRHGILSQHEIELLIEFLYTL